MTLRRVICVGAVLVAAAATTSCSVEQALAAPKCDGGSGLIAAQSVRTAQLVPCFRELPDGWSFAAVVINQSGTVVRLDSDRAGDNAATFRFEPTCEVGESASVPSTFPDVEQFESVEQLQPSFRVHSYSTFEGGCVTWVFDFDKGVSATESVAVKESQDFITREALNANIRETFIDEEI